MTTLGPFYTVTWTVAGTTYYLCSHDLYISDQLYKRKLLNSPEISIQLDAFGWGDSISLEFSNGRDDENAQGFFTTLLASELRETPIKLKRYDTDATHTFEVAGTVTAWELASGGGVFRVQFVTKNPDPLQRDFPAGSLTHESFASDRLAAMRPGDHNGEPYNVIFGHAKKVPARFLMEDSTGSLYDFHLGYGPLEENALRTLQCYFTMVAAGNAYLYKDMSDVADYVVPVGTVYLEYDVNWYHSGARVAVYLQCSDGSSTGVGCTDQNGLSAHPDTDLNAYAYQKWYHRRIQLPAGWTGKTIQFYDICCENNAGGAQYGWISHIYLTDGAGTILKRIWDPTMAAPTLTTHVDSGGGQTLSVAVGTRTDAGGATPTTIVYRDKSIVSSDEFSVFNGAQSNPYGGHAFIRFYKEQRDFSGGLYDICADVRGLTMGTTAAQRNFVNVIQTFLSDSTWGLGLTASTASFAAAAAAISTAMYCDGAISDVRKAQDYVTDLLKSAMGSQLSINESSQITIWTDSYQTSSVKTFDESDGLGPRFNLDYYRKIPTNEAYKTFRLNYGFNPWNSKYAYKNERTVNTFGEAVSEDYPFIRNHETADRLTGYRKNLQTVGDWKLGITVGQDGRTLAVGNRITVVSTRLGISGDFQIRAMSRQLDRYQLHCMGYSTNPLAYSTGTLSTDANGDDAPDYSNTDPAAPTALTLVLSTYIMASDGHTQGRVELSAVLPAVNANEIKFGYRKQGETLPFTYVPAYSTAGTTHLGKIENLFPGQSYEFAAVARNSYGLQSDPVILSSNVAPGDTAAPATPTGLVATTAVSGMRLSWDLGTEADLAGYYVSRATSTSATAVVATIGGKQNWHVDRGAGAGNYSYRVRAFDHSGNVSGFSAPTVLKRYGYYAGSASLGGAATNTDKVNGARTDAGQYFDVYGNVRMMNGKDILFFSGDATGLQGNIRSGSSGISLDSTNKIDISAGGNLNIITVNGDMRISLGFNKVMEVGAHLSLADITTWSGSTVGVYGLCAYKCSLYSTAGSLLGYFPIFSTLA